MVSGCQGCCQTVCCQQIFPSSTWYLRLFILSFSNKFLLYSFILTQKGSKLENIEYRLICVQQVMQKKKKKLFPMSWQLVYNVGLYTKRNILEWQRFSFIRNWWLAYFMLCWTSDVTWVQSYPQRGSKFLYKFCSI